MSAIRTISRNFIRIYFEKREQLRKMFAIRTISGNFIRIYFEKREQLRKMFACSSITLPLLAQHANGIAVGGILYTVFDAEELVCMKFSSMNSWGTRILSAHTFTTKLSMSSEIIGQNMLRIEKVGENWRWK